MMSVLLSCLSILHAIQHQTVPTLAVAQPKGDACNSRGTHARLLSYSAVRESLIQEPRSFPSVGHFTDFLNGHEVTKKSCAFLSIFYFEYGPEQFLHVWRDPWLRHRECYVVD